MTAIALPIDAASCARALRDAAGDRHSVRVRGGDTKSYLGETRAVDVVLETTAMAGIVDHEPADLTVTVAAGTRFADLQRALAQRGQHVPLDPPHADGATIGGIVAARSDGFGRLRYGGVRDLLIGTVVALADGGAVRAGGRVVKNVAGYDLNKLVIGSLGTLGVIAEATLKVLPLPESRGLAIARPLDGARAFAMTDALVRTPLRPSALVVDGTRAGWRVLVGAHGSRAQVARVMSEASRAAASAGAPFDEGDEAALAELRDLPATAADGALLRVALPIAAQRSFAESAVTFESFARLVADSGSGIVRVHLRGDDALVLRAADTLLAQAGAIGGSGHVERRGDTLRARLAAWPGQAPAGDFLMRRIKQAFDPVGILEPGRAAVG